MYQWESTASGRVQLSGSAPPWYRSATQGPRVRVFENGQLIDDTSRAVEESKRLELREQALGISAAPAIDAAQLPSSDEDTGQAPGTAHPTPRIAERATAAPTPPVSRPVREAAKASQLKALIDAWDAQQLEQARSLLDLVPTRDAMADPAVIPPPQ